MELKRYMETDIPIMQHLLILNKTICITQWDFVTSPIFVSAYTGSRWNESLTLDALNKNFIYWNSGIHSFENSLLWNQHLLK